MSDADEMDTTRMGGASVFRREDSGTGKLPDSGVSATGSGEPGQGAGPGQGGGGQGGGGASSSKHGAGHAALHRHGPRHDANVGAIRGAGRDFEQDEYQRELFGDEPTTVPAVIGANVRG